MTRSRFGIATACLLTVGCGGDGPDTGSAASASAAGLAPASNAASGPDRSSTSLVERARALLDQVPLIDGHNDVPWAYRSRARNHVAKLDFAGDLLAIERPMQTDLPRLRKGGMGGQFWSVYIPVEEAGGDAEDVVQVLEQIDLVHRLVAAHPDDLEMAYGADDIVRIHGEGKIASLIGMEGGHSICNSLAVLRQLYAAGARYMTLTHSLSTDWGDSATDEERYSGLTRFGEEVVREMNRLGMLVDLSHVSAPLMHDVLDLTDVPVIFSHSSARAVCHHNRNVPDDVLTRLRQHDGVVMVTFVTSFISEERRLWSEQRNEERGRLRALHPDDREKVREELDRWEADRPQPRATLRQVADHIDHIRKVAGIDHLGVGGDFDGMGPGPDGLEDVSCYPALFAELMQRGYSDEDIQKIAGLNLLRVFRAVEVAALELDHHAPADAWIDELDGSPAPAADETED
jgi:membrane dipeptidase